MKLRRFAALAGAMVLTLGVVGAVHADSGNPADIHAQVSGHTVTVSGDWTWDKCTGKKIVGWAVAWGDPGWASNPLPKVGGGFYYMGDANQGNAVTTTGDPCTGSSGPLGSLSHTYADPGTYDVCVIVYDIVKDQDGSYPIGKHGVLAGGSDRNTDNSVEENELKGESICLSPEIPVVVETHPKISITKSADPKTLPAGGGDVTYTYVVKNAGDVALTGIEVWDDNGTVAKTDDWKVACPKDELAAGVSMTCTSDPMAIVETTHNIATATGQAGDVEVLDAAEETVTVAPPVDAPRIYIQKTASVTELPEGGGAVTYTYLVWNVGNVPLTDVTVVDDKCTAVTGPTGDTGADKILGLTEKWTYTCLTTLTATTKNVGTATGYAGDVKTIDAAEWTVTVLGGGVQGETSEPTAPPTDAIGTQTTDAGGSLPLLLIILGIIGLGAVVLTPARAKR